MSATNEVCGAPVTPPCRELCQRNQKGEVIDHLCKKHRQEGWPGCGWHREWVDTPSGSRFSYLVIESFDDTPVPMMIEPACIVRVVGPHTPSIGKCICCGDPFVTETSMWVEHTTWGEPIVSTVCSSCGRLHVSHPRAVSGPSRAMTSAGPNAEAVQRRQSSALEPDHAAF